MAAFLSRTFGGPGILQSSQTIQPQMLSFTTLNSLLFSCSRKEEIMICFQAVICVCLVFEHFSCRNCNQKPEGLKRVTAPCVLGNKLLNIQFAKYHIWNNKSEEFPNMVLSTERFNQSVRTEHSEAVNARYTFQPLWVSAVTELPLLSGRPSNLQDG